MCPLYRGQQAALLRPHPAMALKPSDQLSDQPSDLLSNQPGELNSRGGPLARRFGVVALVVALVVGVQLGSIPWRYRREIWRLQGFLLGALAGYVLGRLNDTAGDKPGRNND